MIEAEHFLAIKSLSVKSTRARCADAVILNVARHNHRELQAEIGVGADSGIDASRCRLNVTLHGPTTAHGVASAARDVMREHGIVAPRKNAMLGIEIVVSLPAGLAIDQLAYFRAAVAWAQRRYLVPLLSAIVHNDESYPHLHIVLLPVRDGRLVGSELLGNRTTMEAMHRDFHEQVAKQYGLRMPAAKKRHSASERAAGIALLRATLQTNSGLTDSAIDALLVPHARNPEPLLQALGLTMPAAPVKGSFVATMTRKMRPESPNRSSKPPIGDSHTRIEDGLQGEKEMTYALLGDRISSPPSPPSGDQPFNRITTTDQCPGNDLNPRHEVQPEHPTTGQHSTAQQHQDANQRQQQAGAARGDEVADRHSTGQDAVTNRCPIAADAGNSSVAQPAGKGDVSKNAHIAALHAPQNLGASGQAHDVHQLDAIHPAPAVPLHAQPRFSQAPDTGASGAATPARCPPSASEVPKSDFGPGAQDQAAAGPITGKSGNCATADHHDKVRRLAAGAAVLAAAVKPGNSRICEGANQGDEYRRAGQGAAVAGPSSFFRTKAAPRAVAALHSSQADQHQAGDYQRHRDADHPADSWDAERGEFAPSATGPPASTRLHRP